MTVLTVVEPTGVGSDPGFTPATAGGNTFAITDETVLHVRNTSAVSVSVTFTSRAVAEPGIIPADLVVVVPAGGQRDVRVRPSSRFRDVDGRGQVVCAPLAGVLLAVSRVA